MLVSSSGPSPLGLMGLSKEPINTGVRQCIDQLESLLGFKIKDPSNFQGALVHRSYCNEQGMDSLDSYERLEFLGDAVLELTVSAELYRQFPSSTEGQLTKTRSSLVRGRTLARVAERIGLAELLLVGNGVESSGGRQQESVLAAAFEAVTAAIYLDQGMERAQEFILRVMAEELAETNRVGVPPENPKSHLQEYVQRSGLLAPKYRLVGREGPDHGPVFTVEVLINDQVAGTGRGGKKSEAEGNAARAALEFLQAGPLESQAQDQVLPVDPV